MSEKMEVAKIDPQEFGVEKENVASVEQAFAPMIIERDKLLNEYGAVLAMVIDEDSCKAAGDLRRKLVKIRTGIASVHKTQKALSLATGRYIDAWKNAETEPVVQMEEKLSAMEKHLENEEKAKVEALRVKRIAMLAEIGSESDGVGVAQMTDEIWNRFYAGEAQHCKEQKEAAEAKKLADEAAAKAEAEEQERIRKENEVLKAEAKEKERIAIDEYNKRAKAEAIRVKAEHKAESERQAEDAKKQAAHDAELKAERDKLAQIEKAKETQAAEAKVQASKSADKEHCRKINTRIVDQMMVIAPELSKEKAIELVKAFVTGKVEDVSINY